LLAVLNLFGQLNYRVFSLFYEAHVPDLISFLVVDQIIQFSLFFLQEQSQVLHFLILLEIGHELSIERLSPLYLDIKSLLKFDYEVLSALEFVFEHPGLGLEGDHDFV
jgi:hypothetical protein